MKLLLNRKTVNGYKWGEEITRFRKMRVKLHFALLLKLLLAQEADKCPEKSLPKLDFGGFNCDSQGLGGKCTPFCEDGFEIKNANKQVRCARDKKTGTLSWKPTKYFNKCTGLQPEGCPMPYRVGSGVEIIESWVDDSK